MKNAFVADGLRRFLRAQRTMTTEAIEKKYARQLAKAGPEQKRKIHEQMARELRAQKSPAHRPSPGTLW